MVAMWQAWVTVVTTTPWGVRGKGKEGGKGGGNTRCAACDGSQGFRCQDSVRV